MSPKFYIGCSGYYYPSWKGEFYPKEIPTSRWLGHYSTVFNSVELNGTFYRLPRLADLKRYAAMTPRNFRFAAKATRYITHVLKLKNAKPQIEELLHLFEDGLGTKFSKLLFQLPPSFHYSPENLDRISENVPAEQRTVIEFRDRSWWNKETEERFRNEHYNFCNVDFPGLQPPFVNTTKHFYMRFHGVPDLFKSPYTDAQLKNFYARFPDDNLTYHVYFNNTYYGHAWNNAVALMKLVEEKSP
jgi:uncharacterized protein YecE (DUF72 family)